MAAPFGSGGLWIVRNALVIAGFANGSGGVPAQTAVRCEVREGDSAASERMLIAQAVKRMAMIRPHGSGGRLIRGLPYSAPARRAVQALSRPLGSGVKH